MLASEMVVRWVREIVYQKGPLLDFDLVYLMVTILVPD